MGGWAITGSLQKDKNEMSIIIGCREERKDIMNEMQIYTYPAHVGVTFKFLFHFQWLNKGTLTKISIYLLPKLELYITEGVICGFVCEKEEKRHNCLHRNCSLLYPKRRHKFNLNHDQVSHLLL